MNKYRIVRVSRGDNILYFKIQEKGMLWGWNDLKEDVADDLSLTITFKTYKETEAEVYKMIDYRKKMSTKPTETVVANFPVFE